MIYTLGSGETLCYRALMGKAPGIFAVILAAGESSRMGRDKALLPWPPVSPGMGVAETFLSAAIRIFAPYADMVLVVAGNNERTIAPVVYANGASLVVNPEPSRGQFSSLQTGLQEVLNRGRDSALITLVDRPPVRPDTVQTLLSAFERALRQWKWGVIPEYQGKHGHPVLAGRELIEAFLKAPDTSNARDIEHANVAKIEYAAVDDPLVTANVDTPEEYAALTNKVLQSS